MLKVSKTSVIDQATLQEYWHILNRTGTATLSELHATITPYAKGRTRIRIEIQGFENPDVVQVTPYVQIVHARFELALKVSETFVISQTTLMDYAN